jgi:hypothetical protein
MTNFSTDSKQNRDPNQDRNIPANDNGGRAVAPTPAGGAMVSLAALKTALDGVNLSSGGNRSGKMMMLFKAREDNGTWMYGPKGLVPEPNSQWAVNPLASRGYICFSNDNKVIDERLVPISQPELDVTELPDHGFKWQPEWAIDMKCINGADAGVEVVHKATTFGTIDAVKGLIGAVRDRLNSGQHDGKVVPIVRLERSGYQNKQYGFTPTPVLAITSWMSPDGPDRRRHLSRSRRRPPNDHAAGASLSSDAF